MSQDEIMQDQLLTEIMGTLKTHMPQMQDSNKIYNVFKLEDDNSDTYRIVYKNENGFSESLVYYSAVSQTIRIQNQSSYLMKGNEEQIQLEGDEY